MRSLLPVQCYWSVAVAFSCMTSIDEGLLSDYRQLCVDTSNVQCLLLQERNTSAHGRQVVAMSPVGKEVATQERITSAVKSHYEVPPALQKSSIVPVHSAIINRRAPVLYDDITIAATNNNEYRLSATTLAAPCYTNRAFHQQTVV